MKKVLHIGTGELTLAASVAALLNTCSNIVIVDADSMPKESPVIIRPDPPDLHIAVVGSRQEDNWFKKQCKKRGQVTNIPVPSFHEGANRAERRKLLKEQKKK